MLTLSVNKKMKHWFVVTSTANPYTTNGLWFWQTRVSSDRSQLPLRFQDWKLKVEIILMA